MMMEMQMVEGRYFGSARSNWGSRLLISLLNNSWIFLALIRALGVASRLDLLSVMTRSWYYLADFFILSFIWSPTYGQENIHFIHLQLMDWRLIHFVICFLPFSYLDGLKTLLHEGAGGGIPTTLLLISIIFDLQCHNLYFWFPGLYSCDFFLVDIFRRTFFRV